MASHKYYQNQSEKTKNVADLRFHVGRRQHPTLLKKK